MKIVICGRANVGKSSLLNILLKQPRAIVSEIAGTTRDTIEEQAQIKGIPFQLIDTAGFLEPRDLIEEEAIKRSHMHIKGADLILFVIDGSQPLTKDDEKLINVVEGLNSLVVLNKADLKKEVDLNQIDLRLNKPETIAVSALENKGIEELESRIVQRVWQGTTLDTHEVLISSTRHIESLKQCLEALKSCYGGIKGDLSLEFVAEDIKQAVHFLDNITGRDIDQDLIDNIFSQFCIGK